MAEIHIAPQTESERPNFEAWIIKSTACPDYDAARLVRRDSSGAYINDFVANAWGGWVGRANR